MSDLLLWTLTIVLLGLGVLGTLIPGLPGIALVFIGILLFAFATDFLVVSLPFVIVAGFVALLAAAADYAGSALGAKAGGGTWKAMVGGIIGLILGALVLGPLGLFLGAFLGAAVGAFVEGAGRAEALKVASYTLIGVVGSALVQLLLALALVAAFLMAVIF